MPINAEIQQLWREVEEIIVRNKIVHVADSHWGTIRTFIGNQNEPLTIYEELSRNFEITRKPER